MLISIYGYCRVSTAEQNENRQLDLMDTLKIPRKHIFIDKQSGKNTARPGLQKLLATVKHGDTVIVESVSRFARNTKDLLDLVEKLTAKGVEFVNQKENIDTTTPTGKFMLTVFGAVSELERCHILQRQAEGIASAKSRGVKFGRPIKKPPENFTKVVKAWGCGKMTFEEALNQTGLKQATFYNRLRELRSGKKR